MSMMGHLRLAPAAVVRAAAMDNVGVEALVNGSPLDREHELTLEKTWHGIHFLLTGTAWEGKEPLDFLVRGGNKLLDSDLGYGPARAFGSAEVAEISEVLAAIDVATLARRFDPARMEQLEIYPSGWLEPGRASDREELAEMFKRLQHFVAQGAAQGLGLVVWLN
jgi:hypothetical protein